MAERITLTTVDDMNIVGDWVPSPRMVGAVILVHAMPETRSSWSAVQVALSRKGLASLAIDLRGHGDSTTAADGQGLDYHTFTDEDHQSAILDVQEAVAWVRKRGIELNRIALGGASIGANLAIIELAEEPTLAGAVLLSPGADYHGTNALDEAEDLLPDQDLIIVSSEDDAESFPTSKKLYDLVSVDKKTFVPYKNAGHGTDMLKSDPALTEKIAGWLLDMVRG